MSYIKCPRCYWKNEDIETMCESCGLKLPTAEKFISTPKNHIEEMNYLVMCPYCDHDNNNTETVCSFCGAKLPITKKIISISNNDIEEEKSKSTFWKWYVISFLGMCVFLGWEEWQSWLVSAFIFGAILSASSASDIDSNDLPWKGDPRT
jgi:uncharacterized membrane protein YvbJ